MKKLLLLLALLTLGLMVGCSYDDSAILDKITELEKEQEEMQAQIDAQQALLDALANNLTITAVTQNDNGYTITFSDGSSMTIKNGKQGENSGQINSFIESIVVGEEDVTFTLTDGTVIVIPLGSNSGDPSSDDNKIYYTTSDNTRLFPKTDANLYGAILISNTYKDGQGILVFDDAVTMIGSSAFSGCTSLTSITIPDSVTEIGEAVFYGCSSLKEFKGKFAAEDGRYLIVDGKLVAFAPFGLTQYSIPDSVTSIGESAFRGCSSLTSITIPNSVTSIGKGAFYGCTGELIINSKIVETECNDNSYPAYYGWLNGAKFTKLTIGNNVTSIGGCAFRNCSSLTSITIPESVTSIGNGAFYGCTGELIINSKIVETDYTSSYYCPQEYGWLYGSKFSKLTIGDSVTSIGDIAFYYCTSLTSVTIGDRVIEIGWAAFYGCTSLVSVTIPDSVTWINSCAFYGCTSLVSVTIPDSVTWINSCAFYGCHSLTSITIPDRVASIGESAFYGCSSLTSISIPESVTSIGGSAFYGCHSLTSITIPDSVTWIGEYAFDDCSSLTSVTMGNGVTSIRDYVFSDCSSLTSITIPDSVTEIGGSAFSDCSSLTSITIPDSVTSIGHWAFSYCSSLKEVYCKPTTPPSGNWSMFDSNASGRKIYVPTESVEAYRTADYWEYYASSIVGYDFE